MSQLIFRIGLPLALLSVGFGVLVALGRRPTPESRDDSGADQRPIVTTAAVTLHDRGLDLSADGIVVPYREITVAAEVAGVIVFKSDACNEGSFVKKGTELITIDPRDYQFEVRRLRGELSQADINLKELNVELENAEQLVPLAERELTLRESQRDRIAGLRSQRVVSQEQVEEAERGVIAARNALLEQKRSRDSLRTRQARLESAIEVGKVQLEQAELNKSRTTVVAPVDGVIIRDDVEQDSYVQKGTVLFTIEDTSKVEVRCNLRMEELRWVWRQATPSTSLERSLPEGANTLDLTNYHALPPTDVTVAYELGGHVYTWQGVLDRYDGLGLDEQTRMVPCRIVVKHPQMVTVDGKEKSIRGPRSLVRGMYVGLTIHTRPTDALLLVPEKAIQPGNVVWRVDEGKLQRVELLVAQATGEGALVDAEGSGLKEGQQLVVSPLPAAFTGLEVVEEEAR